MWIEIILLYNKGEPEDDFDLQEWRIRAEQDQAYQDSLKADIAKVSCICVYIGTA